ncbi:hypothetical protein ACQKH5_05090 [Hyphomonas sp. NPDC076900]|uniref:hypothetical protein n=1 Tax=unclassified Hyphomonas TaxID=2630699 RepID=UPI003D02B46D
MIELNFAASNIPFAIQTEYEAKVLQTEVLSSVAEKLNKFSVEERNCFHDAMRGVYLHIQSGRDPNDLHNRPLAGCDIYFEAPDRPSRAALVLIKRNGNQIKGYLWRTRPNLRFSDLD